MEDERTDRRPILADRFDQGYSAAASISRSLVRLMSQYTGRGPTKAKTTLNTNFALVVLEDTLTKAERNLVAAGEGASVRRQRETFHAMMRDEAVAAVEEATGRQVRSCLSDVAPDEGIVIELFMFDALPETGTVTVAEAD